MGIYGNARAYQVAFSYRDVPAEVDVLLGWFERHTGGAPGAVLELAAGPGDHAREFGRRGVGATALDLSPQMCRYARDQAAGAGIRLDVVEADMSAFDLGRQVDLSFLLLSSDAHLLDLDAFLGHLDSVARALRPGGLHVIESTHPKDHFGTDGVTLAEWEAESGGLAVNARWGGDGDPFDAVTQVVRRSVRLEVTDADGTASTIEDTSFERLWTTTEIEAAVRLSGAFDIAAWYGAYSDLPVTAPTAWRMIPVLRRR